MVSVGFCAFTHTSLSEIAKDSVYTNKNSYNLSNYCLHSSTVL